MTLLLAKSAVVDISPREETFFGCGPPGPVPPDPRADLEANLLLLVDETAGCSVLFVSLDALYVGPKIRNALESGLKGFLEPDQIFVAASHTHAAPNLDDTKPRLGEVTPSHLEMVIQLVVNASLCLFAESPFSEVHPEVVQFSSGSVINRRRVVPLSYRNGRVQVFRAELLPNERKTPRVSSELVNFRDSEGKVVGCIWIMPCHPISKPNPHRLSPDFVGDVRSYLRRELMGGNSGALVFLQGASGDLRPPSHRKRQWRGMKNILVNLLYGATFLSFTPEEYAAWLNRLEAELGTATAIPAISEARDQRIGDIRVRRRELPLSRFFETSDSLRKISFHEVSIGGFRIAGISAEPTWELRNEIFEELFHSTVRGALVGCIDDTFGYLVTERQARLGGYEVSGFFPSFSVTRKSGVDLPVDLKMEFLGFLKDK